MLLSLFLAWAAVLCILITLLKFLARISGNQSLNRFFFRCHIPFGFLLLLFGGLHSLLAGNAPWATLSDIQIAPLLLTWNWGTACFLLSIGLAITYLLRKKWRTYWMCAHRILTIFLLLTLILHLSDVGIQITGHLFGGNFTAVTETTPPTSPLETEYTTPSNTPTPTDGVGTPDAEGNSFSGAELKDGIYQGSAEGYNGTITVSVTVSDGSVTKINVDTHQETPQFFSRAQAVLDRILGQQSLEVNAVSGATFSSAGLMQAVSNALQGAVVSGTLSMNNIDLSTANRHGGHRGPTG